MNANADQRSLIAADLPENDLEIARSMIGMPIRAELWNNEATRDTIRHYAWGIGDDNPLYSDPKYAAGTRWKGLIAPPTFFFGVFDAVVAPGLPDVQWFYAGADWTFFEPARRGDEFSVKAEYSDARPVGGDMVGRMILQTGTVEYLNQDSKLLARVESHCFRVPRPGAKGALKYEARDPQAYSATELEDIQKAVLTEYRRGAETLFWEDIEPGEVLPGTTRGPLTLMDMTCYYAGAVGTSGYKSTKLRWKYRHWALNDPERLPNNYDPSYYAASVLPSIGHQDAKVAVSEVGMPGPYDNGPQRIGMVSTCVTNWMGDDGFMRSLSVRLHKPVIFGDLTITTGEVTGKRIENGQALVDIALRATNQHGETTASGTSCVELPRRRS
ncbi:MaoC family dehydratase N-terminal domain-containing protein [Aquamicrobium sp. LC103]|uniref:FAS1-like dehydratase domain-containing protein n=1 Tax=Aquamicrobium sp. LC103 TaxID=1120658 RepID=UPI00063E8E9D|nr:MaoC family dehydratase N-terminal domain-containing protein [Aquamicrobium sp. LC103]